MIVMVVMMLEIVNIMVIRASSVAQGTPAPNYAKHTPPRSPHKGIHITKVKHFQHPTANLCCARGVFAREDNDLRFAKSQWRLAEGHKSQVVFAVCQGPRRLNRKAIVGPLGSGGGRVQESCTLC